MDKDKLILFLIKYAGLTPDAAIDLINELPNQAAWLASEIKNSILEDKTISEKFKKELNNY